MGLFVRWSEDSGLVSCIDELARAVVLEAERNTVDVAVGTLSCGGSISRDTTCSSVFVAHEIGDTVLVGDDEEESASTCGILEAEDDSVHLGTVDVELVADGVSSFFALVGDGENGGAFSAHELVCALARLHEEVPTPCACLFKGHGIALLSRTWKVWETVHIVPIAIDDFLYHASEVVEVGTRDGFVDVCE